MSRTYAVRVGDLASPVTRPVRRDASNTGLAGLGLDAADLAEYTGPGGYADGGPYLIQDQVISTDIRLYEDVQVILRRCKILGHIDADSPTASLTMEDCHVDAGAWGNAAVGFQQMKIIRCDVEGGVTGVNGSNAVLVKDSYLHGQVITATGEEHAGGFLCSGGSDIQVRNSTVWASVEDNGHGGGPTANLSLFGDFAPLRNIVIDGCYFPLTPGGYSVSLGYNPSKDFGSDPSRIVFTNNVFARDPATGRGGAFGTVTSFLDSDPSNVFAGNVWADDGSAVRANE